MSAADRLVDGFPHGTREGYRAGCKGSGACPAGAEHGLSCRRANSLAAGDYQYQKLARGGASPAEIAHALGLIPDTTVAAARLREAPAEVLPPEPVPAAVPTPEADGPKPKKWAIRQVWVAFAPDGTMHGPFDGQAKTMDFVGQRLRPGKEIPAVRRRMSTDDIDTLRRLNSEGVSDSEIARRLDRSQAHISHWRRRLGLASTHTKGGKKR